jgi:hypothetical protein
MSCYSDSVMLLLIIKQLIWLRLKLTLIAAAVLALSLSLWFSWLAKVVQSHSLTPMCGPVYVSSRNLPFFGCFYNCYYWKTCHSSWHRCSKSCQSLFSGRHTHAWPARVISNGSQRKGVCDGQQMLEISSACMQINKLLEKCTRLLLLTNHTCYKRFAKFLVSAALGPAIWHGQINDESAIMHSNGLHN